MIINYDLVLLFAFGLVLLAFMFLNKKNVHVEKILFPLIYMVLYRTKIGLILMDRIAKRFPRFVSVFSFLAVVVGFIGMAAILILLVNGTYAFLFKGAPPPVAPLFPGVRTTPGLPVLSFFHWIIAIFILATVHEFSHGLVSRLYNIRVKSSGFAVFSFLLPVIPAAFVEPDEEQLSKAKSKEQLGVLAAGSFSNLITSGVFFLIFLFILSPVVGSMTIAKGVIVRDVAQNSPTEMAGIKVNDKVIEINNIGVENVDDLINELKKSEIGDKVEIVTNESSFILTAAEHPDTKGKSYFGISVSPEEVILDEKYGMWGSVISWVSLLFFWVFAANLGVGLFNLLPMGPLDGGKMFYLVALNLFKKEKIAKKVWVAMGLFCAALIFVSLLPFLARLLNFVLDVFKGLI